MALFSTEKVELEKFLHLDRNGVYYVGHASIIARINRQNFLFDYVQDGAPYGDRWRFFPELVRNIPMDEMSGIFVSHLHQDHYDPCFLLSDGARCPVYVIGGRASFEASLKQQGIGYINLPPGQKIEIAPNIFVYGFLHQSNGVDASCCIGNQDFSVYHGNDNYLNNNILQTIDLEFSSINVACIPYAYINWYPQLLENLSVADKASESQRLCNYYFEYAIEQAERLNAMQVIPFGANLVYRDAARSPLNLECKTPLDFEAYVRQTRGNEQAMRFKALFSGDTIIANKDNLVIHSVGQWDAERYRDSMQEFLDAIREPVSAQPNGNEALDLESLPSVNIKTPTAYDHYICVCLEGVADGVMINLRDSSVHKFDLNFLESSGIPYHIFNISDPDVYADWWTGAMTIENVVGTRCFTVNRKPNIYNPEVLSIAITQL
jgi:L-ascorbate metabolism protein UlaG (beta-lactamase superfamily)